MSESRREQTQRAMPFICGSSLSWKRDRVNLASSGVSDSQSPQQANQ